MKRSNHDGFTLIELLVVIVMAGILAALAAPSWLGFMNTRRVNAANDQVLQALRQAQAESTRARRSQTVVFDTAANPPTITVLGGTSPLGNGDLKPNMVSMAIVNGSASANCPNTSCIEFNGNGNIVNNLGTQGIKITLSAPPGSNKKRCVVVETILGAMRSDKDTACN